LVSKLCLLSVGISFGYNSRSVCTFMLITCCLTTGVAFWRHHTDVEVTRLTQPRTREASRSKYTFCFQFFEEPNISPFKLCQELYVPPSLKFWNSTFSLWVLRTFATFALCSINSLVFITQMGSVYSAVRTESLYNSDTFCLQRVNISVLHVGLYSNDWLPASSVVLDETFVPPFRRNLPKTHLNQIQSQWRWM
jgi:hypothetical protein